MYQRWLRVRHKIDAPCSQKTTGDYTDVSKQNGGNSTGSIPLKNKRRTHNTGYKAKDLASYDEKTNSQPH